MRAQADWHGPRRLRPRQALAALAVRAWGASMGFPLALMEHAMGTLRGPADSRFDFRAHLARSELSSIIDAVRAGELTARRAALLLSPEATEDDVLALAAEPLRRAA